jgi:hypothetical protein
MVWVHGLIAEALATEKKKNASARTGVCRYEYDDAAVSDSSPLARDRNGGRYPYSGMFPRSKFEWTPEWGGYSPDDDADTGDSAGSYVFGGSSEDVRRECTAEFSPDDVPFCASQRTMCVRSWSLRAKNRLQIWHW